jgi:hypothetical protein
MFEARVLFGSPITSGEVFPHPKRPIVVLPIMVSLTSVADLTDPNEAAIIQTNAQELTGDWRSYARRNMSMSSPGPHAGIAPTQNLGSELFANGKHQGLISFAATLPDYKVLVIFRARIDGTRSHVEYTYHDDRGLLRTKRIP